DPRADRHERSLKHPGGQHAGIWNRPAGAFEPVFILSYSRLPGNLKIGVIAHFPGKSPESRNRL
ncbi:MAG: hypothetical protein K5772_08870, partial [Clostridia bacterium]|nr:hypothetical protein [Clostridia bacterium]